MKCFIDNDLAIVLFIFYIYQQQELADAYWAKQKTLGRDKAENFPNEEASDSSKQKGGRSKRAQKVPKKGNQVCDT